MNIKKDTILFEKNRMIFLVQIEKKFENFNIMNFESEREREKKTIITKVI